MPSNMQYSSPLSLTRFLRVLGSVPSVGSGTKEEVGTGDGSSLIYFFDNAGVIESTYSLSYGASETASQTSLVETTHYSVDLDTSKITLTAAGASAVSTNKIFAQYKYNSAGILNQELLDEINAAEQKVSNATDQTFTDSTGLAYKKVSGEIIRAHYVPYKKVFDLGSVPVVKVHTTLSTAYVTGAQTASLTDASLLPSSGTIYVGGNKVSYTAKVGNDIAVPTSTPSISSGEKVRGEVIEMSMEPDGSEPSWSVLDPDVDYDFDYDQGRFGVKDSALLGDVSADDRLYPSNYLFRVSYFHAWHEFGEDPSIPDDIEWVTNAIAARRLMGAVVASAHVKGLNDFKPSLIDVDKEAIQEVLDEYGILHVGTSPYNKQYLS